MEQITTDDLRRAMKLLSVSLSEERLQVVSSFLSQTLETLQPLAKLRLPKELEPTTYFARLREVGRPQGSADI